MVMVVVVKLQRSIKLRKSHIWNIFGKNKRKFMFQSSESMVYGTTKHTIVSLGKHTIVYILCTKIAIFSRSKAARALELEDFTS